MCESFKKEYQLCEEIGRGRFGVVYRCFSASAAASFAVKIVDKELLQDSLDRRCLDSEPKLLLLLSPHPNILQIHSLHDSDSHLLIVTDLCRSSTLFDRLSSSAPFSEPESCSVLSQLVSALSHCHRLGVAHRDVKPDNVLFDDRNRLKLCDFGSAEWFVDSDGERIPMSGVVGTPYYVAPEVLIGHEYNEKVDVWSAGVILYMMLGGVPPLYGETVEDTFQAVIRGNLRFPTKIFRSVSSDAKDLIRKMLCKDVSRRLSAEQVLRHPWIVSGGNAGSTADR
ncbi:hypothetical protein V2J09_007940 [Rumex salicifolius]